MPAHVAVASDLTNPKAPKPQNAPKRVLRGWKPADRQEGLRFGTPEEAADQIWKTPIEKKQTGGWRRGEGSEGRAAGPGMRRNNVRFRVRGASGGASAGAQNGRPPGDPAGVVQ